MPPDTDAQITDEAVNALREALHDNEVTASSVAAAKALLKQFAPPKTDEEQKNETEERERALTEARGLLTEIADLKLAFFRLQNEVAKAGEAPADNAAGELARLADLSRKGLGKNANGS
jgi:hypothetical protein